MHWFMGNDYVSSYPLDLELFCLTSWLYLVLELILKNNVSTLMMEWKPLIPDELTSPFNMSLLVDLLYLSLVIK